MKTSLLAAVCFSFLLGYESRGKEADVPVVLVVPARPTAVQFAFDVARLRNVSLATYSVDPKLREPALYFWDADEKDWKPWDVTAYLGTRATGASAGLRCVMVGRDGEVPARLEEAPAWAEAFDRLRTLNPADLVNELNKLLRFSAREWRWLAHRYGLTLKDQNTEIRRYGKYGPPGTPPPYRPPTPDPRTRSSHSLDVPLPLPPPIPITP
jgi:hypothetical protein